MGLKSVKMPMSLSVEKRVLKDIDKIAKKEFNGNRSAIFFDMYTTWKNIRRAKKQREFIAFDAMVAKAIAEAQKSKSAKVPSLKKLQQYGEEKLREQGIKPADEESVEKYAVEAVNVIRKERKDAFESGN